jgi:lipopolysaccharide export system ATP-binding protein
MAGAVSSAEDQGIEKGRLAEVLTIRSEKMTVKGKENKAVFESAVVIQKGDLTISADRVEVLLDPDFRSDPNREIGTGLLSDPSMESGAVSRLRATGNVTMKQGDRRAESEEAVYDRSEETVTLLGDPVLYEKEYRIAGDKMVFYLKEDRSTVIGSRVLFDPRDLVVNPGEVVGLLGPNGAGKTTTFYMIVGLVAPSNGEVYLDEENITGLPMHKRARKGIGYLPQEPSVFRKLTVEENLLAIMETLPVAGSEPWTRVQSLMTELNIAHLAHHKAFTLSGGEMRRVEITRALIRDPRFLLLDEPFAGIDPIAVVDIQNIVVKLKSRGIGVLITDHNVRETLAITDRAYLINEGRILIEGSSQEIAHHPEAKAVYLGESFRLR